MKSAYIQLIRPKQWLKNVFVLLPVFFGGAMKSLPSVYASLVAFVAFSFVASSVYCFNDIIDAEADRRHPVKCHRPVASGAVSKSQAVGLMVLMFVLSMLTLGLLTTERIVPEGSTLSTLYSPWTVVGIILFYYLLNLGYCAWKSDTRQRETHIWRGV